MKLIRTLLSALLALLVAGRDTVVAYLLRVIPVSVDSAIAQLDRVVAKLERAEARVDARANATVDRLVALDEAHAAEMNNLIALGDEANRAARVRRRLNDLLA